MRIFAKTRVCSLIGASLEGRKISRNWGSAGTEFAAAVKTGAIGLASFREQVESV